MNRQLFDMRSHEFRSLSPHPWGEGSHAMAPLIEMTEEHQAAMEGEGYARPADRVLWAAVESARDAQDVADAVRNHRACIGVYALPVDDQLWACFDELGDTRRGSVGA